MGEGRGRLVDDAPRGSKAADSAPTYQRFLGRQQSASDPHYLPIGKSWKDVHLASGCSCRYMRRVPTSNTGNGESAVSVAAMIVA